MGTISPNLVAGAVLLWSLALSSGQYSGRALADDPDSKRLLVFDLEANGVEADLARNTTDRLLTALKERPEYRVLGRNEIELLLEHQGQRMLLGCEDDSCLIEMGEGLKGDLILSGSLGKVGQAFVLSVRIIDVAQAAVVARASQTALSEGGLLDAAVRAVDALIAPGAVEKRVSAFKLPESAEPVKVAVLDFSAAGLEAEAAVNLTQVAVHELKNFSGLSVISRDEIRSMLVHVQDKMALGCTDESCLSEIGGALGVQYLISGNVGRMGDTSLLHLKLIDIRAAQVANRVAESFQGQDEQFISAVRFATRELVGRGQHGQGRIQVRAEVDDAQTLLDGEAVDLSGETPVGAGKYNLRVESTGYLPWMGDVYVDEQRLTRLDIRLMERPQQWYEAWWLWTTVGVAVAGGVALGLYYGLQGPDDGVLQVSAGLPGGPR